MKMKNLLEIIIIISLYSQSFSIILSLRKYKEKCFYDSYYTNMVLIVNYEFIESTLKMSNLKNDLKPFHFYIKTDGKKNDQIVGTFDMHKTKGKFTHTIEESGQYQICVKVDTAMSGYGGNIRFKLNIADNTDVYEDGPNAVKMKDYNSLNQKVKGIMRRVENIHSIQKTQSELEKSFALSQIKSNKLIIHSYIIF